MSVEAVTSVGDFQSIRLPMEMRIRLLRKDTKLSRFCTLIKSILYITYTENRSENPESKIVFDLTRQLDSSRPKKKKMWGVHQ
jgi:hypothetical protein